MFRKPVLQFSYWIIIKKWINKKQGDVSLQVEHKWRIILSFKTLTKDILPKNFKILFCTKWDDTANTWNGLQLCLNNIKSDTSYFGMLTVYTVSRTELQYIFITSYFTQSKVIMLKFLLHHLSVLLLMLWTQIQIQFGVRHPVFIIQ